MTKKTSKFIFISSNPSFLTPSFYNGNPVAQTINMKTLELWMKITYSFTHRSNWWHLHVSWKFSIFYFHCHFISIASITTLFLRLVLSRSIVLALWRYHSTVSSINCNWEISCESNCNYFECNLFFFFNLSLWMILRSFISGISLGCTQMQMSF